MSTTIAPELDHSPMAIELFGRLDQMISERWRVTFDSPFWQHMSTAGFDRELYKGLMTQLFHYTRFNSINQAMTVMNASPNDRALLRFVFRHADEELGHEHMVVHDLKALGLVSDVDELEAAHKVPAVDALINYLKGVATSEGPIPRLGYSYWAEDVYTHIEPMLRSMRTSLDLTDRQMTFFVAHAEIDSEHSEEVRRIIAKTVHTEEQCNAVLRVAETTLWLTTEMLQQVYGAWRAGLASSHVTL
jgi:pyrroloquinoline quinone (PQQ) biosynthesis protein C